MGSESRSRSRSVASSGDEKTLRKRTDSNNDDDKSEQKRDEEIRARKRSNEDKDAEGAGGGTRSKSRSRSPKRKHRSRSRSQQRSSRRRSRSRDEEGFNEAEGFRLHVADLDPDAEKRDLERIFGKYGPLKEIWMARSVPCFAFVVFRYREDAEDAQRKADGIEICGRRIRVTIARPRTRGTVPNAPRETGRRGFDPSMKCYQCGERGHFSRDCPDSKYGYRRPSSPSRRY